MKTLVDLLLELPPHAERELMEVMKTYPDLCKELEEDIRKKQEMVDGKIKAKHVAEYELEIIRRIIESRGKTGGEGN